MSDINLFVGHSPYWDFGFNTWTNSFVKALLEIPEYLLKLIGIMPFQFGFDPDLNSPFFQRASFDPRLQTDYMGVYGLAYTSLINFMIHEVKERRERGDNKTTVVLLFLDPYFHCEFNQNKKKDHAHDNMIVDWGNLCESAKAEDIHFYIMLPSRGVMSHDIKKIRVWRQLGCVIRVENSTPTLKQTMLDVIYSLLGLRVSREIENYSMRGVKMDGAQRMVYRKSLDSLLSHQTINDVVARADPKTVLEIFESLLSSENIANVPKVLVQFPIFAEFWRMILGQYQIINDGALAVVCYKCINLFAALKGSSKLSSEDKEKLTHWLGDTKDMSAAIYMQVDMYFPDAHKCLIYPRHIPKDVRSLGHGKNVEGMFAAIAGIRVVPKETCTMPDNKEKAPDFLPTNMPGKMLFSTLANLLRPGAIFPVTASYLAAILTLKHDDANMKELASEYIRNGKGTWIDWNVDGGKQVDPTCWSMTFMNALRVCPEEFLTEEEYKFLGLFFMLKTLSDNMNSFIVLSLPKRNGAQTVLGDTWKSKCTECLHDRCFTNFSRDNEVCGLCCSLKSKNVRTFSILYGHATDPRVFNEPCRTKTNWAQCTCGTRYSIVARSQLNVRPKCHYCRFGEQPERIMCEHCHHWYASPGGSARKALIAARDAYVVNGDSHKANMLSEAIAANQFICPCCVENPGSLTMTIKIRVRDIFMHNTWLIPYLCSHRLIRMSEENFKTATGKTKLWRRAHLLRKMNYDEMNIPPIHGPISLGENVVTYNGSIVHNSESVVHDVLTALGNKYQNYVQCSLCAEKMLPYHIVRPCGEQCSAMMCRTCFQKWFSQVQLGQPIYETYTHCPFCKTRPEKKLMRESGLMLHTVRGLATHKWDSTAVYALCMMCRKVCHAMSVDCATKSPEIQGFVCGDCHNAVNRATVSLVEDTTKPCPRCNVLTVRDGGCYHMTCPNTLENGDVCGTHWCYGCGDEFDEEEIYSHMRDCKECEVPDDELGYESDDVPYYMSSDDD